MSFFNSPKPYKGQKYAELRKAAQASGHPFIDPEFPPDDKACFFSGGKAAGIEWKRPKDICEEPPKLFVEGASSDDLIQGELGNCWFVAACSCLATKKAIWKKVIPDFKDQEWSTENPEKYAGIFRFQFWRSGGWIEVVIDDFLPTRGGSLVFIHSRDKNEFWSALLEKAYAKLFGSYEALDGGELAEALEDFTGGVAEPIDLLEGQYMSDADKREKLFKEMKSEMDNEALMAAAIPAKSSDEMEQSTDVGLVKGHAYGITAVKRIALEGTGIFNMFNKEKICMVRLRNPWGGCEWKGAFSDGSEEWSKIDKASREKIGLTFDDDGEFWMTIEDYCAHFTNMCICRQVNKSIFSLQKTWHESTFDGEWIAPARAGGCMNNKDTFLNNPQYRFDVTEDEDEVMIELMQKSTRDAKNTIGFTLIKVEENRSYRIHRLDLQEIIKSSVFKNSRSILLRHTLKKGRYVLLACTFEAGQNGGFLLRIYTSDANKGKDLVQDKPEKNPCSSICCCLPFCRFPVQVTQIKVLRAVGLEKQDTLGGADPYCYLICEGNKERSPICKDTTNPEFMTSFVFYRAVPSKKPIIVEIWNSNAIKDDFMGRAEIQARNDESAKIYEVDLMDKNKDKGKRPGKLFVQISSARNLQAI